MTEIETTTGASIQTLTSWLAGAIGTGMVLVRRRQLRERTTASLVFFIGVSLTGFGSAYYHCDPDNASLLWYRLPMAIGFMSILAAIIAERIHARLGGALLPWLVFAGLGSVLYWHLVDDLRPCLLLQYGTMAALPLILLKLRYETGAGQRVAV